MTDQEQTRGREKNGAIPGSQPDANTSDEAVRKTGRMERLTAGPDGPDAREIGDTFKKTGG